jgi:glutamyl-tRNA synthetase
MTVITRFAPSPTGVLHTGSARTALYNFLYARHTGGKFLLRIEDTDKERSKDEHTKAILEEMKWLGLEYDGEVYYQSAHQERHAEVAKQLLEKGKAFKCYATHEELEKFRQENPFSKFKSPWKDKVDSEAPNGAAATIRLKTPDDGATVVNDQILGEISVANKEIDDLILLRSDGTPTYMLAVVVDDYDMGVTHVIRGDDHMTNTFKQKIIYEAMGWAVPKFAHIPLILDSEGKKLSKRKGALGITEYKERGYLPEAVLNHLLRLGWSHGDDEIISKDQAIDWFDFDGVGKSGAKFDIDKLNFINAHYIKNKSNSELLELIKNQLPNDEVILARVLAGMDGLKNRATTLNDLAKGAEIYIAKREELDEMSKEVLADGGEELLKDLKVILSGVSQEDWNEERLKDDCSNFVIAHGKKPPAAMMALRAGVLGTFEAPGIYGVMAVLGRDETLRRLEGFKGL